MKYAIVLTALLGLGISQCEGRMRPNALLEGDGGGPLKASEALEEYAKLSLDDMKEKTDEIFDLIVSLFGDIGDDSGDNALDGTATETILERINTFKAAYEKQMHAAHTKQ